MRHRATGPHATRPRSPWSLPSLERLEDRTLPSGTPYSTTDILVQFQAASLATLSPASVPAGTRLGPALGLVPGLYEVFLDAGTTVAAAVAAYRADARVVSAEPDYQ